jgi:hypothetical protein
VSIIGSPSDIGKGGTSVLVFRTNGEGVYSLQSLKATDFAVSFRAEKALSRFASNSTTDSTTTVVAAP